MRPIVLDRLLLAEMVLAILPAEEPVDDLGDLEAKRVTKLLHRDHLLRQEDVTEPLHRVTLDLERGLEPFRRNPPRFHKHGAQPILEVLLSRVSRNDASIEERDGDLLPFVCQREDTCLLLDTDQLEDVG